LNGLALAILLTPRLPLGVAEIRRGLGCTSLAEIVYDYRNPLRCSLGVARLQEWNVADRLDAKSAEFASLEMFKKWIVPCVLGNNMKVGFGVLFRNLADVERDMEA
jgi:hypothetical protein